MARRASSGAKLKKLNAGSLSSSISSEPPCHQKMPDGHDPSHPTDGDKHLLRSVRQKHYAGHDVELITTYELRIDGRNVTIHAHVDDDGQLRCHSTPYVSYGSALDLICALIDQYPEAADAIGKPRSRKHFTPEPITKKSPPKKRRSSRGRSKK